MAKNVSLLGADYPDVPSIMLPQTGGGSAQFYDVSDTTAVAADVVAGKYFYLANGQKVVGTLNILDTFFPVGSIYMSTSADAPSFGGTWVEATIPMTWNDVENGTRSYTDGTGTGTMHFWRRTD